MPLYIQARLRRVMLLALCLSCTNVWASHLVGGEFTYRYVGRSISGLQHYQVTLTLYKDCINGQPDALAQDNPAFIAIYDAAGHIFQVDTTIFKPPIDTLPFNPETRCGYAQLYAATQVCMLKQTFVKDYYFPENNDGYTIAYQRCCRNANLNNVTNAGDAGSTYYCRIPPSNVAAYNTSAVFKHNPPPVICVNNSLVFDHSATDADGDSLTYELCPAFSGATESNIKPIPSPPPYDTANYQLPFSYSNPISGSVSLQISVTNGTLSVIPDKVGRYLITVCCNEWRNGRLINTLRREFQVAVVECAFFANSFHPLISRDTVIMVGESVAFQASGSSFYNWSPGQFLTDSTSSTPTGHFILPGTFQYVLRATSDSGCSGNDTLRILVLPFSGFFVPNAFSPNDDGNNDIFRPLPILNSTMKSFKVFNRKGNLVHSSTTDGWDGTYKGVKQDLGVYFWELLYEDNTGKTRFKKGDVTLVR
jgi:gliding motility-associated-like protein